MTPLNNTRSALANLNFSKNEKLKSEIEIQELFDKGSSFYIHPFRIKFILRDSLESPLPKVLISVPKKFFKRAHDRNLIKRRIREAYRLNKSILLNMERLPHSIGFIYTFKEELSFLNLEKKVILTLQRLVEGETLKPNEKHTKEI